MKKIEKLTPEQIARFPEFVERWTKIGLCTDPADRPQAERAICLMYETAGLVSPKKIVWCGSPLSQGLTRAAILDHKLIKNIGTSVWDSVRDSVEAEVRDSVGASVRASVWASVEASVRASVRDSVWDSVRDSVRASVEASVYGQHDAGWLSFYDYFRDAISLDEQTAKLGGLWLLAQSAGWALPHQNICWVSERHNILSRDDRGLLHGISGPAVAFPDGWAIYAWHGTRIPAEWIDNRASLTAKVALTCTNMEQRRAAIEMLGWNAILSELNARTIDTDGDPQIGTLVEVDLPDLRRPARFLRVTCGTGREFAIGVPAEIDTALAAQAWTQNLPPTEFNRPEIRT